jgi:uncharacterized membrane protein YkoI
MVDGMTKHGSKLIAGVFALLVALPCVWADDDHDAARVLRQQGKVLPLSKILSRAGLHNSNQVLEVELEKRHGLPVYEIEILQPNGVVKRRWFDATTGRPLPPEDDD